MDTGQARRRASMSTIKALHLKIAQLELKLEDTVELLHLWKDEASAYQWLAQAIVNGEYPISKAKIALERRQVQMRSGGGCAIDPRG